MELIYIWIDKFRNFPKTGINFSSEFFVDYKNTLERIEINRNKEFISIYPEHILNINAIVGKNSSGKTNFLDLIGLKKRDRNKNHNEFEVRFKKKNENKLFYTNADIESEIKNSIYFFIYYLGKGTNNEDLFIVEGNDIECIYKIFKKNKELDSFYWKEKYWYAFICSFENNKFVYKYKLNDHLDFYKDTKASKEYHSYKSEQDKYAIINFRENFNQLHYDKNQSMKDEDDSYIHIPRRNAFFEAKLLSYKIDTLYDVMQNSDRSMFKENKYTIDIYFEENKNNIFNDNEKLQLVNYKGKTKKERKIVNLFESYLIYFYFSFYNDNYYKISDKEICNRIIQNLAIKKINNLGEYIKYNKKVVEIIASTYLKDREDKEDQLYIINNYESLITILLRCKEDEINDNKITFSITKDCTITVFRELVQIIYDSKYIEPFSPFGNFFYKYKIFHLSDGENAYLGLYASINEQIKVWASTKEKFILLFDEPETRMHPELARNFLNDLIAFLESIKKREQKFQIIVSTHSPFILSDIPDSNVIHLEKDKKGMCNISIKKIDTFGQNIHMLLKQDFFMKSTIGEYAKTQINAVVDFLNSEGNSYGSMTRQKAKYIIESTGEPILKQKLQDLYNENFQTIQHRSESLQIQLYNNTELVALKEQLEKALAEIKLTLTNGDV